MDWNPTPRKRYSSMFGNWASQLFLGSSKPSKRALHTQTGNMLALWEAHLVKSTGVSQPKSLIIQKSWPEAPITLIKKYRAHFTSTNHLCSATFTIAEDKASKSRNHLHCHHIEEQKNKQSSTEDQMLSWSISFCYLHHYLHLAAVITGHKYRVVSFKKADARDTKLWLPTDPSIHQYPVCYLQEQTIHWQHMPMQASEAEHPRPDRWRWLSFFEG